MSTLKHLYDAVLLTNYLDDTVPVHMFTAIENTQGTVSCNVKAKLVVLNLTAADSVPQALELVAVALDEMLALETGTLVYDIRHNPGVEGGPADTALRTAALESAMVTSLAMLVTPGSVDAGAASVQCLLAETKVGVIRANTFGELVGVLKADSPVLAQACATTANMADFAANYGGSVFSLRELDATVIRTSGNGVNPEYFERMFQAALGIHLRNRATTLILDTSDSPAITDGHRSNHFHQAVVTPMASLGLASTLVHVHRDEVVRKPVGVQFDRVCAEWGVFGCEAGTLGEAFALVRVLRGCNTKVAAVLPGVVLAGI